MRKNNLKSFGGNQPNRTSDHGAREWLMGSALALTLAALPLSAQAQTPSTDAGKAAIEAGVPVPQSANVPPLSASDVKPAETTATVAPTEAPKAEAAKTDAAPASAASSTTTPAAAPTAPATAQAPDAAKPEIAKPAVALSPAAEKIKEIVTGKLSRIVDRKDERAGVEAFYAARNYEPLWLDNGAPNARAKAAMAHFAKAADDGLNPDDYAAPNFAAAATPDAQAEAEIKFTDTVLAYARHAQGGRVHYSRVSADILYPDHNPDPAGVLDTMSKASDVGAALAAYQPTHEGYKLLKAKLAEVRGTPKQDEPEVVRIPDGKKLKPGASDERVVLLRKRLNISDDAQSDKYDDKVVEAVKAFQKANDLKADGIIASSTLRKLNGDKEKVTSNVADTIVANMERWRWLPRELGEAKLNNAYVILNIPDFSLKVMQGGKQVWTTRVVTGKPGKHATPMLTETMKYITVNPTWNVPPSIVYNEYLPALQQDPGVLSRMGLKLSQNRDGSVHISQPPGERNALGRIRFNFPNKFLVYQHDTPDKHLFAHESRAYSHGCMRVQNPDQYAEALLGIALPKENYTAAKIRGMYGHSEQNINLPVPIPVNITYQTAFVDGEGKLQLRKDIYGRDAATLANLKGSQAKVADIAIQHAQPNYSRPSVNLPNGVAFAGNGYRDDGPSFLERLFGGGRAQEEPAPTRRPRRPVHHR